MEHPFFKTDDELHEYQRKAIKRLNDKRTREGKLISLILDEVYDGLTAEQRREMNKIINKGMDKLIRGY